MAMFATAMSGRLRCPPSVVVRLYPVAAGVVGKEKVATGGWSHKATAIKADVAAEPRRGTGIGSVTRDIRMTFTVGNSRERENKREKKNHEVRNTETESKHVVLGELSIPIG